MSSVTINLDNVDIEYWSKLPISIRTLVTGNSLHALLNGQLYPTGIEQLELAIILAENSVPPDLISKITRLDKSAFEAFLL